STMLLPFTLTAVVGLLLGGSGLSVDLLAFFSRVALLVATPFVLAWLLRRVLGEAIARHGDDVLGGINVLLLVVFAIAVMDGVTARLLADPGYVGTLLLAACGATALLHLAGYLLFR